MFIILAYAYGALGILVKDSFTSVSSNIICRDGRLILIGCEINIDAVEIKCCNFKVKVRVIYNGVGLAAGGATDIIHSAIFVDLTIGHRSCAGIAMVVAGEVEVNTGCITSCRQILNIVLAAANRIGIVGRYMRNEDLPGAIALCSIFNKPLSKLLKCVLIRSVVQHSNIHITTLNRVPRGRNTKCGLCRNCTIAVIVCFVVTDNMKHIDFLYAVKCE